MKMAQFFFNSKKICTWTEHDKVVEILIQNGANVNIEDDNGDSALTLASVVNGMLLSINIRSSISITLK